MDHQEGFLSGVRDHQIYYQHWLPDETVKGVLLVVHGLAEHSGRYMNLVEHLVPQGYALYALDHIGHGRSEGTRAHVERFSDYTETLQTYEDMVRAWQPDKPFFLFGHSMGGLIAQMYLLERQDAFRGAILSGAVANMAEATSPLTLFAARVLSALAPKAGLTVLDADLVSRDPEVVQAYVTDPLVYRGKIRARLGYEMIKAANHVTEHAAEISLPIMIVHGERDGLVPASGSQAFYERVGSADKTLEIYEGLFHEVCNEPECTMVLSDIERWLEAHAVQ
jgi:alpha-beta hydrolase superfamily lysophospholipase